jgi:hypothetical protein
VNKPLNEASTIGFGAGGGVFNNDWVFYTFVGDEITTFSIAS